MEKNRTVAIIPARGGSKRLPKKNIRLLGDYPLLVHSIKYALEHSDIIEAVYVSTDNAEIKQIALENGANVIDRPEELSSDNASTLSVLQHAVNQLSSTISDIILLQPTNPLRPNSLLQHVFKYYSDNQQSSLFTVSPLIEKLGKLKNDRFQPVNYKVGQRSQDMEPLYYENGLLYIAKTSLIADGHLMTEDSFPYIVDHIYGTVDIDTEDDFLYAEFIMNTYKK